MKTLNTKLETITPAIAEEYLKKNNSNRNVRSAHVDRLKQEMLADRWLVTHQGIAFDEYGNLLDGQHRLIACAMSGKTIQMMVTRGLEAKHNGDEIYTMDVIDCGRGRSTADQLSLMHGVANSNLAAATMRGIAMACAGSVKAAPALSVGQAVPILAIYGEAYEALMEFAGRSKIVRRASVMAALCLGYTVDKDVSLEFSLGLASGENIKRGEPIYALREHLITKHGQLTEEGRYRLIETTANCFYNAVKGNEIIAAKPGAQGLDYLLSKQRKSVETVLAIINRKAK